MVHRSRLMLDEVKKKDKWAATKSFSPCAALVIPYQCLRCSLCFFSQKLGFLAIVATFGRKRHNKKMSAKTI